MKPQILLLILPLFVLLIMESIFLNVKTIYLAVILINLGIMYALKKIGEFQIKDKSFWIHFILPFFFVNGLISYLILNGNLIIIQTLIIIEAFFVFYYLRQIYFNKTLKTKVKWDNISYYSGFLALFFIFSFIFGSQGSLFFAVYLTLILIFALILTTYQFFYMQGIREKQNYIYIFIITLILTEITWVFFFLPFSYNIGGLVLAIIYYLILGLTRLFLKNSLNKKKLKFYLSLSSGCIIIILLTARIF